MSDGPDPARHRALREASTLATGHEKPAPGQRGRRRAGGRAREGGGEAAARAGGGEAPKRPARRAGPDPAREPRAPEREAPADGRRGARRGPRGAGLGGHRGHRGGRDARCTPDEPRPRCCTPSDRARLRRRRHGGGAFTLYLKALLGPRLPREHHRPRGDGRLQPLPRALPVRAAGPVHLRPGDPEPRRRAQRPHRPAAPLPGREEHTRSRTRSTASSRTRRRSASPPRSARSGSAPRSGARWTRPSAASTTSSAAAGSSRSASRS